MGYWEGLWMGLLLVAILGVVAAIGAEVVVACLAYAGYRLLVRLKLLKTSTTRKKSPLTEAA